VTLNATEGLAAAGVVASFMDGDVRAAAGNYKATIDWGDGTPLDNTSAMVSGSNGSFSVSGTHLYADEGSFSVSVTIQDTINTTTSLGNIVAGSMAKVVDATLAVVPLPVFNILPPIRVDTEGISSTKAVAAFTDANPNAPTKDFTATISWGDGQTSQGTITVTSQTGTTSQLFIVSGTHTYSAEGAYTVSVQIRDVGGSMATSNTMFTVADAPVMAVGVPVIIANGAIATNVTVATFTDPADADPAANYTATVNWGDGSDPSVATISVSNGVFTVSGKHTFPAPGKFSIAVTIRSVAGASATANTSGLVGDVNQRFVAAVFNDLLQRPVDSTGLMSWTAQLQQGISRSQVVSGIESSLEYRTVQAQGLYRSLLKRSADPGGLANSVAFLMAGGTVEQLGAVIAGSPEYFQARGGGTNNGFLTALYQDLLNRPIDTNGQTGFTMALANGVTPTQVAAAILSSLEYRQLLVNGFYQQFLLRNADPVGLNGFVTALQNGARDEQIIAFFLSSDEYASVRVGS
jgi:hypothetical protein